MEGRGEGEGGRWTVPSRSRAPLQMSELTAAAAARALEEEPQEGMHMELGALPADPEEELEGGSSSPWPAPPSSGELPAQQA